MSAVEGRPASPLTYLPCVLLSHLGSWAERSFTPEVAATCEIKGGLARRTPTEKRDYVRHRRPGGLSVAEGCRLMGLSRSTYYDEPSGQPIAEARLV